MRRQVKVEGERAVFECDKECKSPFQHVSVSWYFNGVPLDFSQKRYSLARHDKFLYIDNIARANVGEYTCEMLYEKTVYRRIGSLKILEDESVDGPSQKSCSSDCGHSCAITTYIAKGHATYRGEFPWQVMLCDPQGLVCGGVLVSSDCIVTAAHCFDNPLDNSSRNITHVCLGLRCGDCSHPYPDENPQCSKPASFVVHPKYNKTTVDNDIAVMRLKTPALCSCSSVSPVCLPNKTRDGLDPRPQKKGIVTGWGKVDSDSNLSKCLLKGDVQLMSRDNCTRSFNNAITITDSMMCATDTRGACGGDSGGGLVVKNEQDRDRYYLAGIVSLGKGCGVAKAGVYTDVHSHLDWIKSSCKMI